jgi:hypothetical protein
MLRGVRRKSSFKRRRKPKISKETSVYAQNERIESGFGLRIHKLENPVIDEVMFSLAFNLLFLQGTNTCIHWMAGSFNCTLDVVAKKESLAPVRKKNRYLSTRNHHFNC